MNALIRRLYNHEGYVIALRVAGSKTVYIMYNSLQSVAGLHLGTDA